MTSQDADLLKALHQEMQPLTDDVRESLRLRRRAVQLKAAMEFKNYIWGLIVMILIAEMLIHFAYGIVNIVSAISPFGNPLIMAATFTAISSSASVLFTVIDTMYARRMIGGTFQPTEKEREKLEERENAFFIPGCVYDCRIIGNRIDYNTMRYFPTLGTIIVIINVWINEPKDHPPPEGTTQGMRFVCSHLLSLGIQTMIVLCIAMNLYAMRRRRVRIETLKIDMWFETERHWSGDDKTRGFILQ